MSDKIAVKCINQAEADRWIKKLYNLPSEFYENIREVFQEEEKRREKNEPFWALPSNERVYYMVYLNDTPLLIAGVNPQYYNISSFAKVTPDAKFKCKGRECVKKLIEDKLIDKCREVGKKAFSVTTLSKGGREVFEWLMGKNNLPKGISRIERTQHGFVLYLSGNWE